MSYKILSNRVNGEHLQTVIEYTLKDGTKIEIDQAHFQPKDDAQVYAEIENRAASEQRAYDAKVKNAELKVELDKELNVSKEASIE